MLTGYTAEKEERTIAEMSESRKVNVRVIKDRNVQKAETATHIDEAKRNASGDWVYPTLDQKGLKTLVKHSTILPQCIQAYKSNICGFGIGVRYIDDKEETPERRAEFEKAKEIIELLNTDKNTKEVFEDIVEARETYGIAYLEVIRNMQGEVVEVEFISDVPSIEKTRKLAPYVNTEYYHHGKKTERRRKFRKYRQTVGGQTVYFKEFGDPRIMDIRDGSYVDELELELQANEILEFSIGTEAYGEIRWIGQTLGVDGSRKAENLNNNYFKNGRHTPLMIMLHGGTLTDESYEKLQGYMDEIKGENGQHSFIILETESTDARTDFDQTEKPSVEIKDIANILQKDELFQDYLDNNRRKVQSAFRLPDLYVAYTTDFNRATAQTAQEVTEEQVFQPERASLAWVINNKLLNDYNFKYVEAYFLEPDISNMDDLYKLLTVANNAGGLTPNKAKEVLYEALGDEAEDFPSEWGDTPLPLQQQQGQGDLLGDLQLQLSKQIEKAQTNHDDEIVAVMKEVRNLLKSESKKFTKNSKKDFTNANEKAIIKEGFNEEDHPRDDNGRFTSGGGGSSSGSETVPAIGNFGGEPTDKFVEQLTQTQQAEQKVNPKDAWRVSTPPLEKFQNEHPGACCHITRGGSTIAVAKDGDIVGVCKNPDDTETRGKDLIKMAVEAGGTKLDSYEGNHGFYIKCGFEPVSWCKWDGEYAPPGWKSDRDEPEDIIFYKYTGGRSTYETPDAFKEAVEASKDYGAAQAARDKEV